MDILNTKIKNILTEKNTKILPENIKSGVNILGVLGTYEGQQPEVISAPKKDVNFYDYDGTIVYSYSKDEFLAMNEFPSNPTHSGLTAQGWNWSLSDAQEYASTYGKIDIGQMYITDDGKTRLYIQIAAEGRMNVQLCFRQTVENSVEVDWGDGSEVETFNGSGTTNILPTHQYTNIGDYIITLNPLGDCELTLGAGSNSYCIMGQNNNNNRVYQNMLKKVEIGGKISKLSSNVFSNCYSLKNVTIPINITSFETGIFSNCYSLENVTIPINMVGNGTSLFNKCTALLNAQIPKQNYILTSWFRDCYSLSSMIIPSSITSTKSYDFSSCYSLSSMIIPSSITSIGQSTFYNCYGMKFYDFSRHTVVPALTNASAFDNIPSDCKIIVPDNLYDDWIAATNWSTYADYIVKASEV